MTELRLMQIREALERTFRKMEEEMRGSENFEQDFNKMVVLMNKVTELCEGNRELALKLAEFTLKKIRIEDQGEFNYMLDEINRRSKDNVV